MSLQYDRRIASIEATMAVAFVTVSKVRHIKVFRIRLND